MHRIDTATAENGKFVNGYANQGIKGTQVDAPWLNSVQEELCKVIEDNGISLSSSDNTQLLSALGVLIKKIIKPTNASFALAEATQPASANYVNLCPLTISIPSGMMLDVTLSYRPYTDEGNEFSLWIAATSSPETKLVQKTLIIKNNDGTERVTTRLILSNMSAGAKVSIYGSWSGSEGYFADIEGSYTMHY